MLRYSTCSASVLFCTLALVAGFAVYGILVFFLQVGYMNKDDTLICLSGPLEADDPKVLEVLRNKYLDPPMDLPYRPIMHAMMNLGKKSHTWPWINHYIKLLFSGHRDGFFIEAGALDGVYLSNTLWLEQEMNWSGLLIEADAINYEALMKRQRRAWSSPTCISSTRYPKKTIFVSHSVRPNSQIMISPWSYRSHGHELDDDIDQSDFDADYRSYSEVQCFPLISYLAALNVTTVDLLSLDIQGSEIKVLSNYLSSSSGVYIRVIVMEYAYDNMDAYFMTKMKHHGYILLAKEMDYIFVQKRDRILQRPEVKEILRSTTKRAA
ncbi:hypothetical protein Pcinc_021942 [Petrolisthes cinctipes]|uniref:Methyltransferase FkbM domain-containing protein n=1 Tax=Petrolisthes cinctipes TaxID=88211 RepID=A0AAE1FFR3_PETCI|nr:hypothetical protein Pcinc_021942 [Petrolisthes cinctipes]